MGTAMGQRTDQGTARKRPPTTNSAAQVPALARAAMLSNRKAAWANQTSSSLHAAGQPENRTAIREQKELSP